MMSELDPLGCAGFADAETLDAWPNCSVPDCEYKSCLSLNSDKCFSHTYGRSPAMSFEDYMDRAQDPSANTSRVSGDS